MSLLSSTKKLWRRKKAESESKQVAGKKDKIEEAEVKQDTAKPLERVAWSLDLYPLVTEKSVRLQEYSIVTFRVPHTATKRQVAQAIRERYKVEPRGIRMLYGRRKLRRRGRTFGRTAAWKKAYVKVDDVQAISTGP